MLNLYKLGYSDELENYRRVNGLNEFLFARVIAEHKERYVVRTSDKELDAELLGNLRFSAKSRSDFPAVGDWVAILPYDDDKALIHAVLPRFSWIERQVVGKSGEKQLIATNIDIAFIVLSVDRDFNVNRIERYRTICNAGKVDAVVLLNKIDMVDHADLSQMIESIHLRHPELKVIPLSNITKEGISELSNLIQPGKTYCLLGSSGVGKSTMLNNLLGTNSMKTDTISESTQRGRHVTTHRELKVLENGGIIIDNPGMREIGIADSSGGLEMTFGQIADLARECKYLDCTHTTEKACAVLKALDDGRLSSESYQNYLKMVREAAYFESSLIEKRRKDKDFGKKIKNYKKDQFGKNK